MRKQHTTTEATAKAIGAILGEDIPVGTTLTITAPKNQVGRECECGCKGKTSGGYWIPGHDAKHKSRLFQLARGVSGSEQADLAKAELTRRGWGLPTGRKAMVVAPLPTPAK